MYCDILFGQGVGAPRVDEERLVNGILGELDPSLVHMTSAPFRSPEALYRYAHMLAGYARAPEDGWASSVRAPTLVVTSTDDSIAHPAASRSIAARIPDAELAVIQSADHFFLLQDARAPELIRGFLQRAPRPETGLPLVRGTTSPSLDALAGIDSGSGQ
jgi:pimeloyl-ACP methyl ester carboxylesterase